MEFRSVWQRFHLLYCFVILASVTLIVYSYSSYFPPDFSSFFLTGRRAYFFGAYGVAFYVHIIAGPVALVLIPVLLSNTVRQLAPQWHRGLGRLQVAMVVLFVVPSGLWMAPYALTGCIAGVALGLLALCTGISAVKGWQAIRQRKWLAHQLWMKRCCVLLSSAIFLRMIGGLTEWCEIELPYSWAVWISWLLPLVCWEIGHRLSCRGDIDERCRELSRERD